MFVQPKDRCRYVAHSGCQCRRPAIEGQLFCYQHKNFRHSQPLPFGSPAPAITIPLLDDRATLQVVIAEVLRALAARQISVTESRAIFYGLQLASANLSRMAEEAHEGEREQPSEGPVERVEQQDNGEALGPEIECSQSEDEQEMAEALKTWAEKDPVMSQVLEDVRATKQARIENDRLREEEAERKRLEELRHWKFQRMGAHLKQIDFDQDAFG
jgi:hypothetical protein